MYVLLSLFFFFFFSLFTAIPLPPLMANGPPPGKGWRGSLTLLFLFPSFFFFLFSFPFPPPGSSSRGETRPLFDTEASKIMDFPPPAVPPCPFFFPPSSFSPPLLQRLFFPWLGKNKHCWYAHLGKPAESNFLFFFSHPFSFCAIPPFR